MMAFFSFAGIKPSPAIFNYEKLNWMNGQYIKKQPVAELTNALIPHLVEAGLVMQLEAGEWVTADQRRLHRDYLEHVAALAQPRLTFCKDIVQESDLFFIELSY